MAGAAPYVYPSNALTTQFAQASVADKPLESPVHTFSSGPPRLQQAHFSSADRDANGGYFGARQQEEYQEAESWRATSGGQPKKGHVLEKMAGLGAIVDSDY